MTYRDMHDPLHYLRSDAVDSLGGVAASVETSVRSPGRWCFVKQRLSEALALWNDKFADMEYQDFESLIAAARLVERLLPGVCRHGYLVDLARVECPVCHGSGQVWDEGIVEAVAEAIGEDFLYPDPHNEGNWMGPGIQASKQVARVVLSALVELLTEKVET